MSLPDHDRRLAIQFIMDEHMVNYEFVRFFIGDLIGMGANRYVFDCRMNPKLVVKVDFGTDFSNVIEWETWSRVKRDKSVAGWFAPVHEISPCGNILTQSKCKSVPLDKYPKMVPRFFGDLKQSNFGWLDKRIVCLDYGLHLMLESGMNLVMKKVDWYRP